MKNNPNCTQLNDSDHYKIAREHIYRLLKIQFRMKGYEDLHQLGE